MRLAICLFGNLGHNLSSVERTDETLLKKESNFYSDPRFAYESILEKWSNDCEIDFFIHSWSEQHKDEIVKLYAPKKCEIVAQKEFSPDFSAYGFKDLGIKDWNLEAKIQKSYSELLQNNRPEEEVIAELKRVAFRSQSRWWSNKRVIELKREYELENKFKYDFVLLNRFDNLFFKGADLASLDPKFFYASFRKNSDYFDRTLYDFWFLSGSENMDKFAKLYDHIYDYSIRPTYACRSHIEKFIGAENLIHLLDHVKDYDLLRNELEKQKVPNKIKSEIFEFTGDKVEVYKQSELIELLSSECCYIFGAGSMGRRIYSLIKDKVKSVSFIDKQLKSLEFENEKLEVFSPELLRKIKNTKVLIATSPVIPDSYKLIKESGNLPVVVLPSD